MEVGNIEKNLVTDLLVMKLDNPLFVRYYPHIKAEFFPVLSVSNVLLNEPDTNVKAMLAISSFLSHVINAHLKEIVWSHWIIVDVLHFEAAGVSTFVAQVVADPPYVRSSVHLMQLKEQVSS